VPLCFGGKVLAVNLFQNYFSGIYSTKRHAIDTSLKEQELFGWSSSIVVKEY